MESSTLAGSRTRRFAIGAEASDAGTHFRAWAPKASRVDVALATNGDSDATFALEKEPDGYFAGLVSAVGVGDRYWLQLDGDATQRYPDPASRYQPEGPHGPSEVVDPHRFAWTDEGWKGLGPEGQIIYEMHVGTFSPEGTWNGAIERLPALADLGVTVLEVMPVAEFAGTFGWGYDGVDLYAPTRLYGTPDDFRAFVDRAHALGLGVILDVVYNHLGPDGCFLSKFSASYFSKKYEGEWGEPLNFDGDEAAPVREYFVENAGYWVEEFHVDGLRLDAVQSIIDHSPRHVVAEVAERVRRAGGARRTYIVAEDEPQETRLVRPVDEHGYALDAVWNDDFHHTATVALTGRREAYYTDYGGTPQEFVSAAKRGYLYQGQFYSWQQKGRGEPTGGVPPYAFVTFLENHDQVANNATGKRSHALTSASALRAATALLLLGPSTPMLFQGQEFASSARFFYFADHHDELGESVRKGRRDFLSQFPSVTDPAVQERIPAPGDRAAFERCRLDFGERERHGEWYALHRDLIALRRGDEVIRAAGRGAVDGAVLSSDAFVLRYFGEDLGDRLLVVNFGCDFRPSIVPEPLLAPPPGAKWVVHWSSEDPAYGGSGTPPFDPSREWVVSARSAQLLTSIMKC